MMWWGHGVDGFSWEWMLSGGLMMLLFWGGLITLAWLVFRNLSGSQSSERSTDPSTLTLNTAMDILKERYARGEISRAEYEEMRDVLET